MSDIFLIKEAATRIYNIKTAKLGYENGYLWELGQQAEKNSPEVLKPLIRHPWRTAAVIAAVPAALYGYNRYKKWKADSEAEKRNLPKVIPSEVLADADKSDVPTEVLADDSATVPASVKASSYRKVNKVLNWIYS